MICANNRCFLYRLYTSVAGLMQKEQHVVEPDLWLHNTVTLRAKVLGAVNTKLNEMPQVKLRFAGSYSLKRTQ